MLRIPHELRPQAEPPRVAIPAAIEAPDETRRVAPGATLVGYCHGGMVHQPFMESLIATIWEDASNNNLIRGQIPVGGSLIVVNRNVIVRKFLESPEPAEWLWMVDTDMVFGVDTLPRLIAVADAKERPIVSALCFAPIGGQIRPLWTAKGPGGRLVSMDAVPVEESINDTIELGACAMACVIIHRRVLEQMAEAHAADPWPWFGHDLVEDAEGRPARLGEDQTFCVRARALGFAVHGHRGVEAGHVKTHIVGSEAFYLDRAIREMGVVGAVLTSEECARLAGDDVPAQDAPAPADGVVR
ncbi:MAG: hypothetical protein Q8S13_09215 [Dehalococcoidia bacterium]|nr:hypothetical protein [Dehalococcoidia bacterium]